MSGNTNGHVAAPVLPESPASATTTIMVNGFEFLFTIREPCPDPHAPARLLDRLQAMTAYMLDRGITPVAKASSRSNPKLANGGNSKNRYIDVPRDGSPPVCPEHNIYLRSGQYGWFCPKKNDDGEWCNVRAKSR